MNDGTFILVRSTVLAGQLSSDRPESLKMAFDTQSRTAWISKGFEHLVDAVKTAPNDVHFDVLIIGSGYGGAVAAATLAGRSDGGTPLRIAVLERGLEYLPGSFPTGLAELPKHVRSDGNRQGLFDVRPGPEVNTILANGVGGGSLINAGVMETPRPDVFQSGWPAELSDLTNWSTFYDRAAEMVGARIAGAPNQIDNHPDGLPLKHQALQNIAPGSTFKSAEITVAMNDRTNAANVSLNKCLRCGDCATGCNFGAKESLDLNLLVQAHQAGAEIFSGGTVLHLLQDGQNWIANAVFTEKNLRLRDGTLTKIRAKKVIVAAGTLGSNEILMRSHAAGLPLSTSMLGKQCSTNGDMLATDFDTQTVIKNVADQTIQPSLRQIGPTITGVIDLRDTKGILIEEISVPASLRVAFSEVFSSVNALHALEDIDWSSHATGFSGNDDYAVPPEAIERSAVFAIMGDDGAAGHIQLDDTSSGIENDGAAVMRWSGNEADIFAQGIDELSDLTKDTGGRLIANPLWRLLPEELSFLTGGQKGPVTTVHPLGGLVMADSGASGVVNSIGQVFQTGNASTAYETLAVLDGSILPTALGTNPALTIAAVALRASEALVSEWGFDDPLPLPAPAQPFKRPIFRETDHAIRPRPTEVEVIERVYGPVRFAPMGIPKTDYIVELTLQFEPKAVQDLNPALQGDGTLIVADNTVSPVTRSEIRIFKKSQWDDLFRKSDPPAWRERKLDALAIFRAPLTGTLKVLEREKSSVVGRLWRAARAWLLNRGLRDVYQAIFDSSSGPSGPGFFSRLKSGIAIASRAGAIRTLTYDLEIGAAVAGADITLQSNQIVGVKRFTYNRRGNPWRQLMEITLDAFPGLDSGAQRVLQLDTAYLARIGVPLFRIKEQEDSVSAIADLLGFFGYFIRLLLGIHIWSFRAPDERDPNPTINFEPPDELLLSNGTTVSAEITLSNGEIEPKKPDMAATDDLIDGEVRITRYRYPGATKPPVVMFHGYSAGGTTFAHHAVNPNFASHLLESGRDVLIAELRTSPYYTDTTATKPWSFDQIARVDVPYVIDKALELTGADKVDVMAHCMGTIVVSRAILQSAPEDEADALYSKIRRVAFTQVGPLVVFSPTNILRGFIMRYLIEFLPDDFLYQFRPENPTLADDLWDRVVATLPYPIEEFDIENPVWPCKKTPWTQTRHRMDALYGRDFSADRMEQGVLDNIDEHFGALNLRTVGSVLHYARHNMMTNFRGKNDLVARELFDRAWRNIPTFSVHGAENGLSNVATVNRMEKILNDAGIQYLGPHIIEGAGHQDALIGADRLETFEHVRTFFDADLPENPGIRNPDRVAYPPWIGPILTREEINGETDDVSIIRIGAEATLRKPEGAVLLRVHVSGERILRPDDMTDNWDNAYILSSMAVYLSEDLSINKWDAFELPRHNLFPNHEQNTQANATLILLVYDEAPNLNFILPNRYFGVFENELMSFDRSGSRYGADPNLITLKSFSAMRDAVAATLSLGLRSNVSDPEGDPGKITFRGLRDVERTVIDPRADGGLRRTTTSQLIFGPNEAFGAAALDNLEGQDFNLLDGIVPDQEIFPDPVSTRFMFGSCQYPAGMLDDAVAYRSYGSLVQRLQGPKTNAPRFMLFVGDQVYVDPTAGLFDPRDLEDRYRTPYENWLRAQAVRTALRSAPSFMLLDDHEIIDNWEPKTGEDQSQNPMYVQALTSYTKYEHGLRATRTKFEFDKFPFFLLDTRSERNARSIGSLDQAKLFEPQKFDLLTQWFEDHQNEPKFIITPSLFLPRHRRAVQRDTRLDSANLSALHSDGWNGYLEDMRKVLAHIAQKEIKHVVFLSGDEHRACFAIANINDAMGAPVTKLVSIHTSALWAPFPFANGKDADTVDNETFTFADGTDQFSCTVATERPAPGDGPTYISIRPQGSDWVLECEFSDGTTRSITLD